MSEHGINRYVISSKHREADAVPAIKYTMFFLKQGLFPYIYFNQQVRAGRLPKLETSETYSSQDRID